MNVDHPAITVLSFFSIWFGIIAITYIVVTP